MFSLWLGLSCMLLLSFSRQSLLHRADGEDSLIRTSASEMVGPVPQYPARTPFINPGWKFSLYNRLAALGKSTVCRWSRPSVCDSLHKSKEKRAETGSKVRKCERLTTSSVNSTNIYLYFHRLYIVGLEYSIGNICQVQTEVLPVIREG